MIYLDTHAAFWLIEGRAEQFSKEGARILDKEQLYISPFVLLEFAFLHEIGRITLAAPDLEKILINDLDISVKNHSSLELVRHAVNLKWTRDPFDRMIVAQATIDQAKLVTRDRIIRKHYNKAIW